MADAQHVYEDQWGEIIDRPGIDVIELRWYDSTAASDLSSTTPVSSRI